MGNRFDDSVSLGATGANITTSAASASVAIPNTTSGTAPVYIRIASTAAATIRLGKTTATAVATDALIQPGDSLIVPISGRDIVAALMVTTPGIVNITPLENA